MLDEWEGVKNDLSIHGAGPKLVAVDDFFHEWLALEWVSLLKDLTCLPSAANDNKDDIFC